MENKYMEHKMILKRLESVLFLMLGIFCLAFKTEALPTLSLGPVPVSAKDLLGLAYIITGYVFGRWPSVHFVRPRSMEPAKNNKVLTA